MQVGLGKNTLGGGNKMNVELKDYGRSTHDLGNLFRTTMSPGTIVPFYKKIAQMGDTWNINLRVSVLTKPTVGPLFGGYIVDLHMFTADHRLYNAQLHNNKLGIGMNMERVKFPQIRLTSQNPVPQNDMAQINPSCLLHYNGIKGLGWNDESILRDFNAMPILIYWDIFKQYFANRQETNAYVVHWNNDNVNTSVTAVKGWRGGIEVDFPLVGQIEPSGIPFEKMTFTYSAGPVTEDTAYQLALFSSTIIDGIQIHKMFNTFTVNGLTITATNTGTGSEYKPSSIIAWSYLSLNKLPQIPPRLQAFALENIDTMREKLLQQNNASPYIIGAGEITPYGYLTSVNANGKSAIMNSQEGLAVKTYNSDKNNNWIRTDWIDGDNGVNEITKIDVSDGFLKVDAIIMANKVYNYLNRIAVSGGSYSDYLRVSYTTDVFMLPESPVYHGGLRQHVVFQEVVSNSAAVNDQVNQPLGTLGGRGVLNSNKNGGHIEIKIKQPGYVYGVVMITPEIDYSQGNDWDMNLKTMQNLHVPALDGIGYQDLITDEIAWWDTKVVDGVPQYKSAGKQTAWLNYQTSLNELHGNFAIPDNEMFMTLARRYEESIISDQISIKDLTTYIDPAKYNYIFAQTSLDAMNFWVQIAIDAKVRRVMSAKQIPNL